MIDLRAGLLFFDAPAVVAATDRTSRKALSKFGAFVRQRAKSSMRKRKAAAPAGSPPSVHVGTIKRRVYFAYDPARQSVVVGPTVFARGEGGRLNEHGGRGRLGLYPPRPFMRPAFAQERKNVDRIWADAERRS
jgi:hypothetical protein